MKTAALRLQRRVNNKKDGIRSKEQKRQKAFHRSSAMLIEGQGYKPGQEKKCQSK